jgi:hypothetical protein
MPAGMWPHLESALPRLPVRGTPATGGARAANSAIGARGGALEATTVATAAAVTAVAVAIEAVAATATAATIAPAGVGSTACALCAATRRGRGPASVAGGTGPDNAVRAVADLDYMVISSTMRSDRTSEKDGKGFVRLMMLQND